MSKSHGDYQLRMGGRLATRVSLKNKPAIRVIAAILGQSMLLKPSSFDLGDRRRRSFPDELDSGIDEWVSSGRARIFGFSGDHDVEVNVLTNDEGTFHTCSLSVTLDDSSIDSGIQDILQTWKRLGLAISTEKGHISREDVHLNSILRPTGSIVFWANWFGPVLRRRLNEDMLSTIPKVHTSECKDALVLVFGEHPWDHCLDIDSPQMALLRDSMWAKDAPGARYWDR